MKNNLNAFLEEYFTWNFPHVAYGDSIEDLAEELKRNNYCFDSYHKALTCPINKRRDTYCGCTQCVSYEFCSMLRKEGYL